MPNLLFSLLKLIYEHWLILFGTVGVFAVVAFLKDVRDLLLGWLRVDTPIWLVLVIGFVLYCLKYIFDNYWTDKEVDCDGVVTRPHDVIIRYERTGYLGVD